MGGVLGSQQDRPSPLPPEAEPLHEAQHREQDGGRDPDGGVAGEAADQERREAHQQQREDQHSLPPDPVPEVPEDHAPDRPREEANREGGEGCERARERRELREEQLVEDEGGGRAVEKVVVPLYGGAHKAREGHLPDRGPLTLTLPTDALHDSSSYSPIPQHGSGDLAAQPASQTRISAAPWGGVAAETFGEAPSISSAGLACHRGPTGTSAPLGGLLHGIVARGQQNPSRTPPGKWPSPRRIPPRDFRRVFNLQTDLRRVQVGHALQILYLQQPELVDAWTFRAAPQRRLRRVL